jgi:HlyD family secretion protein
VKRVLIGAGVILALAAIVFLSIKGGRRDRGVRVYVEPVVKRHIERIVKATGEIDPRVKVNLSAHVVGKIEELYVEEGDRIEAGQPFLRLEREAFLAVRDRAKADLEIARSRVRQAEITLADADLKLQRARRLNDEQIGSQADLEAAELNYRSQELAGEQAREAVLQAQAALDKAEDDLYKTTIYAPLSGRVTALNAEEGEVVVSGTMNNPGSVIGTISDLSEILAEVDVDETEVAFVEVGQSATLTVDALPDHEFTGKVVEIGSSGFQRPTNPDVTYFKTKILLDAPDPALRPGMSARVEIVTAVADDALVVPVQCVVDRPPVKPEAAAEGEEAAPDEPKEASAPIADEEIEVVFVVVDGKAEQRAVDTGLSDITHVQILSGVNEGESVVTGPYRSLKDLDNGDAVRPRDKGEGSGDEEEDAEDGG